MEFTAGVNSNNWVDNSGSYSLTLELPVALPNGLDYDVVVYKKQPNDRAEKMYPTIDISPTSITIHSENPYMGYALITKRGTYVGEEIVTEIHQAANDAYTATSKAQSAADRANIATFNANTATENAETATTRANNIAQTLETAYVNGDFVGERGEEGESIYPVYDEAVIDNNPSSDDVFTIDADIVAIRYADKPIRVGDSIIDGLGNIYVVDRVSPNASQIQVFFTGTNIRGPQGPQGPIGPQGIQGPIGPQGEGVPSGGTVGQVLTKTASGTAWEDAKGGGGGKSLLFLQGTDGYGLHQVFFKLPSLEGVKKVTVSYTEQYDAMTYRPDYRNDNVVIYENGERLQDVYLYLLFDNSSLGIYDNVVGVPIEWDEYGFNEITLNFGIAIESAYGQYGSGVSTSILFTLEY
jgi:hypothetical protein